MYKIALPLIALGLSACATKTMDPPAPVQTITMPDEVVVSTACEAQSQTVYFQTGSAALDSNASATMENISKIYAGCDLFRIDVEGYSDTVGDSAANLDLSNRRADSVLDSLMSFGVTADRVRVVPMGERTAPGDGVPNAFERRVVVSLIP